MLLMRLHFFQEYVIFSFISGIAYIYFLFHFQLQTGIDVNIKFGGPGEFEFTPGT